MYSSLSFGLPTRGWPYDVLCMACRVATPHLYIIRCFINLFHVYHVGEIQFVLSSFVSWLCFFH